MRIVQKFGGTSVADIGRLESVALKVKREIDAGHHLAVVVSAMAGVTNQLVGYVKALAGATLSSEYDAVVSTGEQITTALLALALQQIGVNARSFMGWQLPIQTDHNHGQATIHSVNPTPLLACWDQNVVPIIAGFQGVTSQGRLTTLGRGGSDTTAVAVAASLHADRCDIYTDVDGVYTADPRAVPLAKRLKELTYDEMLQLAVEGAKVLHAPCVEIAKKNQVPLRVLSSFEDSTGDSSGTLIIPQNKYEESRVTGITSSSGWVLLTLFMKTSDGTESQSVQLKSLLEMKAIPHEISVNPPHISQKSAFINILIPQGYLATVLQLIEHQSSQNSRDSNHFQFSDMKVESRLAKIAIIGLKLLFKKGFNEHLLKLVNQRGSPLTILKQTPQKLCLCVAETSAIEWLRTLHHELGLDKESKEQDKYEQTQEPLATRM